MVAVLSHSFHQGGAAEVAGHLLMCGRRLGMVDEDRGAAGWAWTAMVTDPAHPFHRAAPAVGTGHFPVGSSCS